MIASDVCVCMFFFPGGGRGAEGGSGSALLPGA